MNRFSRFVSIVLPLLPLAATAARAEDGWPNKPIKLIVPYAAAGPSDVIGRFLATSLSRELGQQVIVDNRPGAGFTITVALPLHAIQQGDVLS